MFKLENYIWFIILKVGKIYQNIINLAKKTITKKKELQQLQIGI